MRWAAGGGSSSGSTTYAVRGGSGGTAVGVDSLDRAALGLGQVAEEGVPVAARTTAAATDVDLVAGAVLSRATGAAAIGALTQTAALLTGELLALVELAVSAHAAASAYRTAEATAARAVEELHDRAMEVGGLLAPELLVGFLALGAAGVDVPGLVDRGLFDHPWVAELAGGADGLVAGLRADPLTAPLVAPARARDEHARDDFAHDDVAHDDLAHDDFAHDDSAETDLDEYDVDDYEGAVSTLADSAARWGLLDDRGRAVVTPEPAPRPGARAPRSLRDLVVDQGNIGDGERYAGHVRVIEVPQPEGSVWIVEVSAPRPGRHAPVPIRST